MRAFLTRRIPKLVKVTSVTQDELYAAIDTSLAYMVLIALDCLAGLFGSRVPNITISCRCGLALLKSQETGTAAPIWALWLGAALETRWALPFISYPGHLQDAMVSDYARSQYVIGTISA